MTNRAVIIDYARSAFAKASTAKKPGRLSDVDPLDLIVPVINTLIDRTNIDVKDVKKILMGNVHQEAQQGLNIARMAVLHDECKLDNNVTGGTSIDRFCGSSLEAIAMADAFLARNPDEVYICAGVQSMSIVPMSGLNPLINQHVQGGNAAGFMNMGVTAENLAVKYEISRIDQDAFAVASNQKTTAAHEKGHFKNEIVAIKGVDYDDGARADSSIETLAKLRTAFKSVDEGGTVTAGNSSQVTDGASAVMVTSESFAAANNLPVKAIILGYGEASLAPEIMGLGPVDASKEALKRAGLTMADIDIVELNEAFAAQSLAVMQEFEKQGHKIDPEKVNLDGGAIAMGHPLGASGARIVGHLSEVLQRENKRYGLATMCIGGGQGVAMVIENPAATPKPSV
jgi:acetyl-CoA acyltransferase|tara:strand:+ start:82861 stop:84057 length:1197 start_codon:yes stop_codon:yes gene_type:complete